MHERSRALFERSQELIPGGVNSPVRAFRAVGGTPVFFREGRGGVVPQFAVDSRERRVESRAAQISRNDRKAVHEVHDVLMFELRELLIRTEGFVLRDGRCFLTASRRHQR